MQRFCTVLTMICLMLMFFVSHAAYADDPNGDVEVAKSNEASALRKGNSAYDHFQNANTFYLLAKAEYEANAKKIERGEKVTVAKLLAATGAVIISGGVTSPR